MVVLQDTTLRENIVAEQKSEPHVLVNNSASVGRAVVNGCFDVGKPSVRFHEEANLGLGPPHSSTHLVVIKRCDEAAAVREGFTTSFVEHR